MVVDGRPNVRVCVTPLREGMRIERQRDKGRLDSAAIGEVER
jgi:hypothetical protein